MVYIVFVSSETVLDLHNIYKVNVQKNYSKSAVKF